MKNCELNNLLSITIIYFTPDTECLKFIKKRIFFFANNIDDIKIYVSFIRKLIKTIKT